MQAVTVHCEVQELQVEGTADRHAEDRTSLLLQRQLHTCLMVALTGLRSGFSSSRGLEQRTVAAEKKE